LYTELASTAVFGINRGYLCAAASRNSKILHLIYIKFYTGVSRVNKSDTRPSEVTTDVTKVLKQRKRQKCWVNPTCLIYFYILG